MTDPNFHYGYSDVPGGYYPPTLPEGVPAIASSAYPVEPVEQPLFAIGDITVTHTSVIVPHGRFPLRGTTWTVQDSTVVTESIPAWAVVMAILFAVFCLLGLLFLLVKEKRHSGFIFVTVVGPGLHHSVQLPPGQANVAWATNLVNQARSLAAAA